MFRRCTGDPDALKSRKCLAVLTSFFTGEFYRRLSRFGELASFGELAGFGESAILGSHLFCYGIQASLRGSGLARGFRLRKGGSGALKSALLT